MSDEPEDDRPFAFFRNTGQPATEEGHEAWAMVRDEAFPIPIVEGTREPSWAMATKLCDQGCHVRICLIDEANDQVYVVHDLPVIVAHASGMLDFEGTPNPMMRWVETRRRVAVLN